MGKKRDKEEGKKKKKRERMPCCERDGVKRGAWTAEEDKILVDFITQNGHGTWRNLPKLAGLLRCGKSCRLRWTNYLRPDIKRGPFSPEEENTIIRLHEKLGNKWAAIATHLPGRTDNDIKNFWNSHLRKRFVSTKVPDLPSFSSPTIKTESPSTRHMAQWECIRLEAESRLSIIQLPLNKTPTESKPNGDYFLSLWNSQVGESFRTVNNERDGEASHSPTSQTSSSLTKAESGLESSKPCENASCSEMGDQKVEVWNCKKESEDDAAGADYLDESKSNEEMDDSSDDAMMEMLLDFPVGDNDVGYLQAPI